MEKIAGKTLKFRSIFITVCRMLRPN